MDVPFEGLVGIAHYLQGQIPKKTSQKGAWLGVFQQIDKKLKISYLRSCLIYHDDVTLHHIKSWKLEFLKIEYEQ